MFRLACLLALSAAALGLSQSRSPAEQEREKDVYAIYSLLMTDPDTNHGAESNPRYLIAETTQLMWRRRQPCVEPPKDRAAEFQQVLADFERGKNKSRTLKRQFSIPKSYELLNEDAVTALQSSRGWPKPKPGAHSPSDVRFDGVTHLFTLSDVYFSSNGKLALTAIASWCGGLCGQHQWKVVEKLPTGQWRELPSWVTCFAISDSRPHRASRPA